MLSITHQLSVGFVQLIIWGEIMKLGLSKIMFSAVFAVAAVFATPAVSEDDPSFISAGVGWYDFNDDMDAIDLRLEYRSKAKFLGFVKPWLGVEVTSDIAAYGVAGVLSDFYFGRRWVLTPSFGIGVYADGDGKDLGSAIEFRSQIEFGYRFDDRSRVSLAVGHISNAHLTEQNPGTEIATIYYHFPLE